MSTCAISFANEPCCGSRCSGSAVTVVIAPCGSTGSGSGGGAACSHAASSQATTSSAAMRLTLVGRTGRRKIAEPARGTGERRDIPFSERAFEDLYRDTFGSVWSIARRAARDDMEADDVAQQAYLAVYRYWSKGQLRVPPAHLLYRVAK